MRFWTIQPREVWEQMERGEEVRVDSNHPHYASERVWQYDWLVETLRSAGYLIEVWPWWLYCEFPDPEEYGYEVHPSDGGEVRLELELATSRRVTFPLWMWDTIHRGSFLAISRAEVEIWRMELSSALPDHEDLWPLPEPWRTRLETSWERLLDPKIDRRCWFADERSDVLDEMGCVTENLVGITPTLRASEVVEQSFLRFL